MAKVNGCQEGAVYLVKEYAEDCIKELGPDYVISTEVVGESMTMECYSAQVREFKEFEFVIERSWKSLARDMVKNAIEWLNTHPNFKVKTPV